MAIERPLGKTLGCESGYTCKGDDGFRYRIPTYPRFVSIVISVPAGLPCAIAAAPVRLI